MKSLILILLLCLTLLTPRAQQAFDGDDFNRSYDSNHWIVSETPGAHLTQSGDGVLRYLSDQAVGFRISDWRWIGGFPLFTDNWGVQMETHAGVFRDNAYPMYSMKLIVRNASRSYGIGTGPINPATPGPDFDYVFLHRDSTNLGLKAFTNRVLALRLS